MLEKESITTDVLVVGGGVSGLGAALAARTHGVSVTVAAKGQGASVHYDAMNAPFGHADPRDNEDVYYPNDIIGQGITLAYRAGAELVDMEFVQFEPTGVYHPEKVRGLLIPTAMFGEGGILLNKNGKRFVATSPFEAEKNAHKHDLDLLIAGEIEAGRGLEHGGVYFDGTAIPSDVLESYPARQKRLRAVGIDLKRDLVEVGPVAHSLIGGVWMDSDCQCSLGGLFAAGEVAGGVHGANRMAGNGGAETVVFGKIGGDSAGKYAAANDFSMLSDDKITLEETRLNRMIHTERTRKPTVRETKSEIQTLVASAAGVIRNGRDIEAALDRLDEIKAEKSEHLPAKDFSGLIQCLEVKDTVLLAEIILGAALRRCESRGAHYRSDFPDVDDETWRKNIIVKINADRSVGFEIREISTH